MSYTGGSFGAAGDWPDIGWSAPYHNFLALKWSTSEVYVYRFRAKGMPAQIESTSQVYPLVKAYVQSLATGDRNQDVRGITLMPLGAAGEYQVEIVVTDAGGIHLNGNSAEVTALYMNKSFYDEGSSVRIDKPALAKLNEDNRPAYALWFSQAPIWSYAAFDAAGKSSIGAGYTKAYLDGRGVWLNSTASRTQYELQPRKQPEIAPPSATPPATTTQPPGVAATAAAAPSQPQGFAWYLAAVAALGLAAAMISSKRGRR